MKSLIIIAALISCLSAQNPVPLPQVNLANFEGDWWFVWSYASDINNATPNPVTCLQGNFDVSSDGSVTLVETFNYNGQSMTNTITFNTNSTGNSVWTVSAPGNTTNITWIARDPLESNWFLGAANGQDAFLISRSPSQPNVFYHGEMLLLQAEGYTVNSTNFYTYNNTNC